MLPPKGPPPKKGKHHANFLLLLTFIMEIIQYDFVLEFCVGFLSLNIFSLWDFMLNRLVSILLYEYVSIVFCSWVLGSFSVLVIMNNAVLGIVHIFLMNISTYFSWAYI